MKVVDYFAGVGGFTEAAQRAGAEVVCAVNHWPLAVEAHRANHPSVDARCEDLTRFDPRALPPFDALVASPACQGHSRARGVARGGARDQRWDPSRATAWSVIDTAETCRPRAIVVENVGDFLRWDLFDLWRASLARLGYDVRHEVLNASAWGVPQERARVFVWAVRGRAAPPVAVPRRALVPVSDVLDFDAGAWSLVSERVARTRARVARGRASFGQRFVMPYNTSGSGLTGRSLARPIGTITAADRWALVDGDRMRMLLVSELRACMGFPARYQLPAARAHATAMLGNAVVPAVAEAVVRAVMEAA